ncbi:sensor of ECF-type sigma factor [Flavobacterium laiguense]|uniref:Sensor of ECF-type sigma factor n=1 Tax=Flavobacterium laiguense TaxID=2169409 RepID=A0A2U1JW09_9FLAO|nr:sensor of ECF-type sigma factor [Flavobacterium laiguense]PWA09400.1 sensor of ECF-type sigma factor [Flavobacterium laiguense]
MNIRKLYPILFLFMSFTFYAQGERMKEKKEQIKAMKVAFLTTELNLTSNEAEKFWPIYNTFDDKQFELRHKKLKGSYRKMDNDELDKLSEKEAKVLLNQIESNEEELFQLRKKFISNLKDVLPAIKIIKLKKAEENFSRKLLQQYRDNAPKK